ncbi:uncharacterized protein LOC143612642 [Bidens hawaiensis]|uniref:uncharacterized protein LOC143612642 n=1 Tax=Bidens hawaiensis TaxID=980011 RepID=UPI00404AF5B4
MEVNELEEGEPAISLGMLTLYTDGASSIEGSGAGLIITYPRGTKYTYALRLEFPSTNNEVEYKALIAVLHLGKVLKIQELSAFVDSRLVASQVNNEFIAREPLILKYKQKVKGPMKEFKSCSFTQVSRTDNKQAEALSKLAFLTFTHLTKKVLVEVLKSPSIEELEVQDIIEEEGAIWMTPITEFLKEGKLPTNEGEALKFKLKASQYLIEDNVLYKKGYLCPLLRCVGLDQNNYLVREVHEGLCGTHSGPRSVVTRLMKLGYYWATMDFTEVVHKCEAC